MNDEIWTPEAFRQFADKVVGSRVKANGKWIGEVTSAAVADDSCRVAISLYPQELPALLEFEVR